MTNPLFSTYTQGENRVTSTLLAVLEHVNSRLGEDILEALVDESDLSLVAFDNQVTGVESVPDAAIRGSTALWFETKTSRNAVRQGQLEDHLEALDQDPSDLQRLIVLTPDERVPSEIQAIDDDRLVWASFDTLVGTLESVLERDVGSAEASMYVPTEREAFLLRELMRFIYDEELVSGKEDRVLVVAARRAWDEYHTYDHYFCQPNRSFKPVSHLAFYKDGKIKAEVPRVTGSIESITLDEDTLRTIRNSPTTRSSRCSSRSRRCDRTGQSGMETRRRSCSSNLISNWIGTFRTTRRRATRTEQSRSCRDTGTSRCRRFERARVTQLNWRSKLS